MNFALGHAGVRRSSSRSCRSSTDDIRNGQSGLDDPRARRSTSPASTGSTTSSSTSSSGPATSRTYPSSTSASSRSRSCCSSCVFGLLTLVDPRAAALGVGPRHARGAQHGGRGRGVGHRGQPDEDPDLRPVGRDRRLRRRAARHVHFSFTNTTAPLLTGLFWLALAVTFGIRRPAARCSPASRSPAAPPSSTGSRRGRSSAAATCSALITSIYFVPILSGLGAIQLAQEPDGILASPASRSSARSARRRDWRASPRPKPRRTAARSPSTSDARTDRRRTPGRRDGRRSRVDADVAEARVRGARRRRRLRRRRGAPRRRPASSTAARSTALLGANGAGKSTLCAVAAGHRRRLDRHGVPRGQGDHRHRAVPARPRRRAARARGARHLPRPHRGGEPHRAPARRRSCARRPTSASRSSPSGASRWPVCSRAASSRC